MTIVKDTRSITHKFSGERITFLETGEETNGDYEYIEVLLPSSSGGPPLHYHMNFKESFEVLGGELKVVEGKKEIILRKGDTLTVPKGTHHTFLNASNENEVTFRVKIEPAHNFEKSMRILYGLIGEGKANEVGMPHDKIHGALILDMSDSRYVAMPFFVKYLLKRLAQKGYKKGIAQELINKYCP
ncbi:MULTISPECIES: cupin domain-containing protein [unclassified Paenibacillus]|uniref:cupin domain-containing protein n=1 Tax=unclassified Paenibacillus TaxID=185978 RepID=UPI00070E529E|nr:MULTISPECIES: cupin domain-containing protein [unclassified Paenibacillus]KQX51357.1 cupin [Paenibacillus sp. Root444D2]KRE50031.1 cupin [Paenibacillus sp. Soil724D2]